MKPLLFMTLQGQCVRVTPNMVHSLQPKPDHLTIDPSIDIIHPEGSGKNPFQSNEPVGP